MAHAAASGLWSFVGFVLEVTGSYMFIFAIAGTAYLLAWLILKLMIPRIEPITISMK